VRKLKLLNQVVIAFLWSLLWSPLYNENGGWAILCIILGVFIMFLMDFQDYEDDVLTFILLATVPLIVGLTLSPQVQQSVTQWGFLGAIGVVFMDGLLFIIMSFLWYLVLDYEDFIPFRKD